jgi:iron complex transport system substrate-binding protein
MGMKKLSLIAAFLVFLCFAIPLPAVDRSAADAGNSGGPCPCRRIVSLAPSVTEILFGLGLGDKVAGVTRYCRYPPEARKKTQVGGYVDPNYEELLRLQPDLTIMLTVHTAAAERLRHLGLATLTVDHTRISGIINSIMTIGNACGAAEKARRKVDDITAEIGRVRNATKGSSTPRVLISVDRNTDAFSSVYIAGKNTCYDELISIAGGVNAYSGAAAYPAVSIEGILHMNPQVIIDLVPNIDGREKVRAKILAHWKKAAGVEAVQNGRVYLFEQDYTVIPGPRFIDLLEDMVRAIHPELHEN